jgi:hypothetical protein
LSAPGLPHHPPRTNDARPAAPYRPPR